MVFYPDYELGYANESGGVYKDVSKLPLDTEFLITSEILHGKICESKRLGKYMHIVETNKDYFFEANKQYILPINIIKKKSTEDILEYPCSKCNISYCYKNCEEYNEWLENILLLKESVNNQDIIKLTFPRELLINTKTIDNVVTVSKYKCPTCNTTIPKVLIKRHDMKYCFKCGQLFNFMEMKE